MFRRYLGCRWNRCRVISCQSQQIVIRNNENEKQNNTTKYHSAALAEFRDGGDCDDTAIATNKAYIDACTK